MERSELKREIARLARDSRRGGRSIKVSCPNCVSSKGHGKHPSLSIDAATGLFYCFRCEVKGKLRSPPNPALAARVEEARWRGAGVLLHTLEETPELVEVEPPDGYEPLGEGHNRTALCLEDARNYAARRGLSLDDCERLGVGACIFGRYAGRLILPIRGEEGAWLGWVGRDYTGLAELSYAYPPGYAGRTLMFNSSVLYQAHDEPALGTEGWLDGFAHRPEGFAFMGMPNESKLLACVDAKRPVVFVLDGDAWLRAEAHTWRLRLEGVRSGYVRLPPKIDPDQVPHDWLMEEARRSLERPL